MTENAPQQAVPTIAPHCAVCGYHLAGIDAPVCPECATPRVDRPGSEFVEQPWPCVVCGYSLLGAKREGRCSECGGAIARSLDQSLLRFQPYEYLARVQRGALFLTLGLLITIFGPVCLAFIALALAGTFGVMLVVLLVYGSGLVLIGIGVFGLTCPPPGSLVLPAHARRARRVARFGVVAGLVLLPCLFLYVPRFRPVSIDLVPVLIAILTAGMWVIVAFATLWTIRAVWRHAVRKGVRGGRAAAVAMVIIAAALVVNAGNSIAQNTLGLAGRVSPYAADMIRGITSLVIGVLWLATFVSVLGASEGFRAAVKRERTVAKHARRAARPPAPRPETPP